MSRVWKPPAWLALAVCLGGCAVGPDYVRPAAPDKADQQAAFLEDGAWRQAMPSQPDPSQPWWEAYGDVQLNALVAEATRANQTLAVAAAQYRQAQALVQGASAAYYPAVGVSVAPTRARTVTNGVSRLGNSHAWTLAASWEPDLWGSVRRSVEAAQSSAQGSAADLAAAQLAVQASVVNSYLQLRVLDRQQALYTRTIASYRDALRLTQAQHRAGVATGADVALAQSTLATAEAQAVDLGLSRRQLAHALAVLLGKTPADFALPPEPEAALPGVPGVPLGLPSQLLERRPDIAGAERRVQAANAQIGVAKSAYFPNLTLNASGGNSGPGLALASWAAAPTKVWALGAVLGLGLFDGGARSANIAKAEATFDAAAATYRQTVLSGFQEVEDNLAALRDLQQESEAQQRAVVASGEAAKVSLSQYRAGTVTYLNVITTQALLLTAQRTALQVQGRQFAASVALIKALGGGFQAEQLTQQAGAKEPHHEQ